MRSLTSRLRNAVAAVFVLGLLVARAQDFNLSRDFSTRANPSGVWSYGWETDLGHSFAPVTFIGRGHADNGVPFDCWSIEQYVLPGFYHYPLANTKDGTANGGAGVYPPGSFAFHPGQEGTPQNYALVRFTAPSNGFFRVAASVRHYLNGGPAGDTEFHVLKNGESFLSQFMAPTDTVQFTNTFKLKAGGTLDFATGRGEDGQLYGSGLLLELVIDAVPSASSVPGKTTGSGAPRKFRGDPDESGS